MMATMSGISGTHTFELSVNGGTVRGELNGPSQDGENSSPWPVVMLCRGLQPHEDESADLFEHTASSLRDAGLATLEFEPRAARMIMEDFDAFTATDPPPTAGSFTTGCGFAVQFSVRY